MYQCSGGQDYGSQHGEQVVLIPKPKFWDHYFLHGKRFSDDFPDEIEDAPPEEREVIE